MSQAESLATVKPPESATAGKSKGKGGRPRDPNKLLFNNVGLRAEDWEYLKLWGPVDSTNDAPNNPTAQIGALVEYTRTMARLGPGKFGHEISEEKRRAEKTTPAIANYAKKHGISKAQATNMAWKAFMAAQEGENGTA